MTERKGDKAIVKRNEWKSGRTSGAWHEISRNVVWFPTGRECRGGAHRMYIRWEINLEESIPVQCRLRSLCLCSHQGATGVRGGVWFRDWSDVSWRERWRRGLWTDVGRGCPDQSGWEGTESGNVTDWQWHGTVEAVIREKLCPWRTEGYDLSWMECEAHRGTSLTHALALLLQSSLPFLSRVLTVSAGLCAPVWLGSRRTDVVTSTVCHGR